MKWIIALLLTAVLLAGVAVYYAASRSNSDDAPVAEVNGVLITTKELRNELGRQRAAVIDYFYRTYGAVYDKQFWKTGYKGENPEDTAKKWAIRAVVKSKLELELAEQKGLIAGTSYNDLLREMDKENKRRQAAVKANKPVYGPARMDEDIFMNYYISNLRNELKERMSGQELSVTDEQLKQYYEQVKDTLFAKEDGIEFEKAAVPYRGVGSVGSGAANRQQEMARERIDAIKQLADRGEGLNEAENMTQDEDESSAVLAVRFTEEELNGNTAGMYFKSQPVLYSVLKGSLKAGEVSEVFDEPLLGEYVLVRITAKETADYEGFDANEQNVRNRYLDAAYTDYLNKLYKEARIHMYANNLDKIAMR